MLLMTVPIGVIALLLNMRKTWFTIKRCSNCSQCHLHCDDYYKEYDRLQHHPMSVMDVIGVISVA